jgi:hypothetical protein
MRSILEVLMSLALRKSQFLLRLKNNFLWLILVGILIAIVGSKLVWFREEQPMDSNQSSKDLAKLMLDPKFPRIDEMSDSSNSKKSVGSDLDYRQK